MELVREEKKNRGPFADLRDESDREGLLSS